MQKLILALGVAILLGGTWAAQASQYDQYEPQAHAYLNYAFGGRHIARAPLRYGLRMDAVNVGDQLSWHPPLIAPQFRQQPSLLQVEGDFRGNSLAMVGGVPFAAHIVALHQGDSSDGSAGTQTASGGFTWFDWGLLAAGVGGVGYVVYRATKGSDSPDPPSTNNGKSTGGTTGGLLGGLLGGSTTGTSTGGTLGGLLGGSTTGTSTGGTSGSTSGGTTSGSTSGTTTGGLLGGLLGGTSGFGGDNSSDFQNSPEYQSWLDGGTGHMGDLSH